MYLFLAVLAAAAMAFVGALAGLILPVALTTNLGDNPALSFLDSKDLGFEANLTAKP